MTTAQPLFPKSLTSQASAAPSALEGWRARVFATDAAWSPLVLRVVLALVMFPHGAQKALGWFGGYGLEGTMGFFTETVGLPAPLALLVIALEFLGPVLLLSGLLTRAVSLGFAGIMAGAIWTTHLPHGFFMNWSGSQAGEGYEFHLLVLGMAVALVLHGAGRFGLDRKLAR